MTVRSFLVLVTLGLASAACASKDSDGCSRDSDCKSSRVCLHGHCVVDEDDDSPKKSVLEQYTDDVCRCADQACVSGLETKWKDKLGAYDTRDSARMSDRDRASMQRALACAMGASAGKPVPPPVVASEKPHRDFWK